LAALLVASRYQQWCEAALGRAPCYIGWGSVLRTQVRRYVHIPVWGGERDAHAAAKAQEARGDQAITRRQHRLASPHQKVRHALTVCTKLTNATAGVRRDGRRAPCRSVMLLCAVPNDRLAGHLPTTLSSRKFPCQHQVSTLSFHENSRLSDVCVYRTQHRDRG